jgi:hypothetical protein
MKQNSKGIDDLFIIDVNQFQDSPLFSSKYYIPEIKDKEKINSRNSISKIIKKENYDNFEFKENNNYRIEEINKIGKLSINVDIKKMQENSLKSKYLNKKYFSLKKLDKNRENFNSFEKHTKFSSDNLQRKCLTIILNNTLEFINNRIKKIYKGNIGNGMNCKKLLNVQLKSNLFTIDFIKNLLHKTLGEIFSDNIRIRYTNYIPDYNFLMIKKLLNEKDQDKRMHLEKLFGITFLQCVKKFAGLDNSEELDGFITFNEYKDKLNQEPEYLEALKDYLINFEENIRRKKAKNKKNKINQQS